MPPIRPANRDLRQLNLPHWIPVNEGGTDPQSVPVTLYPSVYALELENDKYYIGLSTAGAGVEQRLSRHAMHIGSNWCQMHPPVRVVDFWYPADKQLEDEVTMYYAALYGRANVRGGSWTRVNQLPPPQA
jgi:predicted GIY-YIG superfamily endonuclease